MSLIRRLTRAVPWLPWLPVLVLTGLLGWSITHLPPDFSSRQLYVRAGLLVAGLGLSFAFDDPAAPTTDPVPSSLRRRRLIRIGLSLLPWLAVLGVLIWSGTRGGLHPVWFTSVESQGPELPVGRLVLEGATMASWCLAISSVVAKRWDDEPGKIASAALLALYAGSWLVPERWKPWALPTDPRWTTALPWWWGAFVTGLSGVVFFSWDSQRQGLGRRWARLVGNTDASNPPEQPLERPTPASSRSPDA